MRPLIVLFATLLWLPLGLAAGPSHAKKGPGPEAKPATPAATESEAQRMELVRATIAREFGTHLKLAPAFPPMFGDFDGDGVEDLAVVVTGNPAQDQAAYNYKLIDPYHSFFGYGDPKVMMTFPVNTEQQARYVAICHQWRTANPKLKFVIVNLEFGQIQVGSARFKKKVVSALFATDTTGLHAQIYWDGHKYRWVPVGTD
ncbi:MAG: hypothetical protein ABSD88_08505 [Candidatus Korobacteraceae bacterium]|jgi:hypothetical protein